MTLLYIYKEEDIHKSYELLCLRHGDHYVGRETPIVCKDKRISRKHAIVVVHRNGAMIKATHANPTFFKSHTGGPIQILQENDTVALNNGDCFALIENSIWFTIKITHEHEEFAIANESFNAISNKRVNEDNIFENNKRIKIEDVNVPDDQHNAFPNSQPRLDEIVSVDDNHRNNIDPNISNGNNVINNSTSVSSNEHIQLETSNLRGFTNGVSRPMLDKILPIDNTHRSDVDPVTTSSTSAINRLNESLATDVNVSSNANNLNETIPINPSTSNPTNIQINNSVNDTHIKQEPLENIDCDYTTSTVSNFNNSAGQVKVEIKEEPVEKVKEEPPDGIKDKLVNQTDKEPLGHNPDQPSGSGSTENSNHRREKCWYGKLCYRKNPFHKVNFSHPTDDDYDSDSNDNRPVCPFNIHCYRRNVIHRRQYRHFGPPAPKPNNINVHVNVINNLNNPNQKPDYESDCESDPDED